jgi:hypothetical protein
MDERLDQLLAGDEIHHLAQAVFDVLLRSIFVVVAHAHLPAGILPAQPEASLKICATPPKDI